MNPYLEQTDTWEDFHTNFIVKAQAALNGQVGPNYLVKVEMRLILHEIPAEERRFLGKADVGVSHGREKQPAESAVAMLDAPVVLDLPEVEVEQHVSLEIRDRRTGA